MGAAYRFAAFCLLFLVSTSLFIFKPSLIDRLALRLEDTKFAVRDLLRATPVPVKEVVVVAIDEKSVNILGRWPWSREVLAKLIDNLSQAKVVALDIVFSEPQGEEDKILAEAIARAGNVILGLFFRPEATQEPTEEDLALLQESEFFRYELFGNKIGLLEVPHVEVSIKPLTSVALGVGFLNAEPDHDAMYRKYVLAYLFRGGVYLPLALQALRHYEGRDIFMKLSSKGIEELRYRDVKIPVYEGRFHRINFYRPEDLKVIPAVDVIEGEVDPSFFKGKAVFVGATEIGIYDVRPTPIDPVLPGVFLHAMTFSNFRAFHFIYSNRLADVLTLLLCTLVPALSISLRDIKRRVIIYGFSLILLAVVSYGLFSFLSFDLSLFYGSLALLLSVVTYEGLNSFVAERNIKELRRAFSSYVSPQLLEIITRNPEALKLGGEKRTVTVLFSDIRGFTGISEGLPPEKLVALLNEFLTPMTDTILKNGGMLDKYIGDAIMALFNAPVDLEDHADRACRSALEMVALLKELNGKFKKEYGVELKIGVGINTGEAVVGNMGSRQRFDYTAIGDTVNLASRLEGLNKLYKTEILLSEFTKEHLREGFLLRRIDRVVVKGRKGAVLVYELLEDTERNRRLAKVFEQALDIYFKGDFEEAKLLFEEISLEFGDETSLVFANRCKELIKNPPARWEGVYVAREK